MEVFWETDAGIAMLELLIPGAIITAIGCYSDWKMEKEERERKRE